MCSRRLVSYIMDDEVRRMCVVYIALCSTLSEYSDAIVDHLNHGNRYVPLCVRIPAAVLVIAFSSSPVREIADYYSIGGNSQLRRRHRPIKMFLTPANHMTSEIK